MELLIRFRQLLFLSLVTVTAHPDDILTFVRQTTQNVGTGLQFFPICYLLIILHTLISLFRRVC